MKRRELHIVLVDNFITFSIVPDGCAGRSLELDIKFGGHYRFFSIGKFYGGKFWARTGGF